MVAGLGRNEANEGIEKEHARVAKIERCEQKGKADGEGYIDPQGRIA